MASNKLKTLNVSKIDISSYDKISSLLKSNTKKSSFETKILVCNFLNVLFFIFFTITLAAIIFFIFWFNVK